MFEGPKHAGKTTLAKQVAKRLVIPLVERPIVIENFKRERKCWDIITLNEMNIIKHVDWIKNDLIFDRSPIVSELVWSEREDRNRYIKMEDIPVGSRFIFTFCSEGPRKSDEWELQKYNQVFAKILENFNRRHVDVIPWDTSKFDGNIPHNTDAICGLMRLRRWRLR